MRTPLNAGGRSFTFIPAMRTSPASGSTRQAITRRRVVFPAVRPDDDEELAVVNREADSVQGQDVPEPLRHIPQTGVSG
jgi:hypothetical protein